MTEFRKYPSIPRYRKDIVITEKIDGTNACVGIIHGGDDGDHDQQDPAAVRRAPEEDIIDDEYGEPVWVFAQSRNGIITPGETDNHGFAAWVRGHHDDLYRVLRSGWHYGEWWGSGINRGYGLKNGEKHFSLFNPARYDAAVRSGEGLVSAVPVLYEGPANTQQGDRLYDVTEAVMDELLRTGSRAPGAEGYPDPEGIVVYHTAARQLFKVTYEYDEGKWSA